MTEMEHVVVCYLLVVLIFEKNEVSVLEARVVVEPLAHHKKHEQKKHEIKHEQHEQKHVDTDVGVEV